MRRATRTATPTPAPIPALAPVERPELLDGDDDISGAFVMLPEGMLAAVPVGVY